MAAKRHRLNTFLTTVKVDDSMIRFVSVLVICALLMSPAGCGGKGENGKDDAAKKDDEKMGNGGPENGPAKLTRGGKEAAADDTLLMYYGDDPDTLNYLTSSDNVSTTFQRQVYESLAQRKFDDPQVWEPMLAESWEFDEENLEYTIKLRQGVMWHPITLPNGKELPAKEFTSRDVKFTFDCILNEHIEAASLRSYYEDPESEDPSQKYKVKVTVIDKYTIKVKWTKPYFMAAEWSIGIGPIPRHVYSVDKNGEPISFDFSSKEFADGFNNHWANSTMCGTGPLIFKEWKKGERVTLERNPNYWGQPFYFSRVVYQFISNTNTALQKLLQNELDWGAITEKDQYIQSKENDNVKAGKVVLKEFPRTAYRYLGYNLDRPMLREKKVRMALSHAIPVQRIIDEVFYGLANRVTGPFLEGSVFTDPNVTPIPFDLEKARQLLDEAGWKDTNNNGIRDKEVDGKRTELKFEILIFPDAPSFQATAEIIKAELLKAGVEVQLAPTAWSLMLQKLNKKEFDSVIIGWGSDWKGDPFQVWHGSQADVPDSSNFIHYRNEKVDKLIEKLRVTMKEEDQIPIYQEIHRLIYEDQPYTFLFAEKATVAIDSRIQNIQTYSLLRPHVDLREWYSTSPRVSGK